MKFYVVWDNDNYGSLCSPSQDEIDTVWTNKQKADWRCEGLNMKKLKGYTRARVQEIESRE